MINVRPLIAAMGIGMIFSLITGEIAHAGSNQKTCTFTFSNCARTWNVTKVRAWNNGEKGVFSTSETGTVANGASATLSCQSAICDVSVWYKKPGDEFLGDGVLNSHTGSECKSLYVTGQGSGGGVYQHSGNSCAGIAADD